MKKPIADCGKILVRIRRNIYSKPTFTGLDKGTPISKTWVRYGEVILLWRFQWPVLREVFQVHFWLQHLGTVY